MFYLNFHRASSLDNAAAIAISKDEAVLKSPRSMGRVSTSEEQAGGIID
jgi:hypothetical protein